MQPSPIKEIKITVAGPKGAGTIQVASLINAALRRSHDIQIAPPWLDASMDEQSALRSLRGLRVRVVLERVVLEGS